MYVQRNIQRCMHINCEVQCSGIYVRKIQINNLFNLICIISICYTNIKYNFNEFILSRILYHKYCIGKQNRLRNAINVAFDGVHTYESYGSCSYAHV